MEKVRRKTKKVKEGEVQRGIKDKKKVRVKYKERQRQTENTERELDGDTYS